MLALSRRALFRLSARCQFLPQRLPIFSVLAQINGRRTLTLSRRTLFRLSARCQLLPQRLPIFSVLAQINGRRTLALSRRALFRLSARRQFLPQRLVVSLSSFANYLFGYGLGHFCIMIKLHGELSATLSARP